MLAARLQPLRWGLGGLLVAGFALLGVVQAFVLPPFQVPDERAHWLTAHHHLARLWTGSGSVCSTDVALDRHFRVQVKFRPTQQLPRGLFARVQGLQPECEHELLYPTGHAWSYPGVLASRLFLPREPSSGVASLLGFYLSRLLHGALIAALLARLLWLSRAERAGPPAGLLCLLLLCLSPLFLQQSFAVSIDVVTNAFALSLCGWLVFGDRLRRLDRLLLVALAALSATGKPVLALIVPALLLLGLALEPLRSRPLSATPIAAALAEAFRRQRGVVLGLAGLSAAGLLYAQGYSLSTGRAARQLDFIRSEPWRAAEILLSEVWRIFSQPSFFLDYLGHLETRIGASTLWSFTALVVGIGAVEALALGAGLRRLAGDSGRRSALRRAGPWVALLTGLALASIAASVLLVAFHAYLSFTRPGAERIGSLQPRYYFPHLLVGLGLVCALARSLLGEPAPAASPGSRDRLVRAVALLAAGIALLVYATSLFVDLLLRYC